MMTERKLALYVSDKCRTFVAAGKGLPEFRLFVQAHWPVLSSYKLLVSASTAAILKEIALELKQSQGVGPQWDLEISDNTRALVVTLVATSKLEVERILWFLDSRELDGELERLWILRQIAAERGQKLNINLGAWHWAEREWNARSGRQNVPLIGIGDALVFVGRKPSPAIDRFVVQYREKVVLFPQLILTNGARPAIAEFLSTRRPPASLSGDPVDDLQDIRNLLVANYYSGLDNKDNVGHVIVFQEDAIEDFIEVCADPQMRVNLMLNKETAEEWIQQPFRRRESSLVVQ